MIIIYILGITNLSKNPCFFFFFFFNTILTPAPAPPFEKKLPKIRELSDFNEIFSVDLSMNEFYNASVILFQNLVIFSGHLTLTPTLIFWVQNIGGVK